MSPPRPSPPPITSPEPASPTSDGWGAKLWGPEVWTVVTVSCRGALALVSPVECAGCGAPDRELCPPCREKLRAAPLFDVLPDGTPVVSALDYVGVVRDVILSFKQEGRWRLARALGPAMARALELACEELELIREGDDGRAASRSPAPTWAGWSRAGARAPAEGECAVVLVAVPSSPKGRRRRGYEPVHLLLSSFGGHPARGGLRLVRASGSQKGRTRAQRAEARSGSLRASPRLSGQNVIVIDDVTTTGSTLVEAVRALEAVGARVLAACCLAATPLMSAKGPGTSAEPTGRSV